MNIGKITSGYAALQMNSKGQLKVKTLFNSLTMRNARRGDGDAAIKIQERRAAARDAARAYLCTGFGVSEERACELIPTKHEQDATNNITGRKLGRIVGDLRARAENAALEHLTLQISGRFGPSRPRSVSVELGEDAFELKLKWSKDGEARIENPDRALRRLFAKPFGPGETLESRLNDECRLAHTTDMAIRSVIAAVINEVVPIEEPMELRFVLRGETHSFSVGWNKDRVPSFDHIEGLVEFFEKNGNARSREPRALAAMLAPKKLDIQRHPHPDALAIDKAKSTRSAQSAERARSAEKADPEQPTAFESACDKVITETLRNQFRGEMERPRKVPFSVGDKTYDFGVKWTKGPQGDDRTYSHPILTNKAKVYAVVRRALSEMLDNLDSESSSDVGLDAETVTEEQYASMVRNILTPGLRGSIGGVTRNVTNQSAPNRNAAGPVGRRRPP